MTLPTMIHDDGQYLHLGVVYSGLQISAAIDCAYRVAYGYELADDANGGHGSVSWGDMDAANEYASSALPERERESIINEVRVSNGFELDTSHA